MGPARPGGLPVGGQCWGWMWLPLLPWGWDRAASGWAVLSENSLAGSPGLVAAGTQLLPVPELESAWASKAGGVGPLPASCAHSSSSQRTRRREPQSKACGGRTSPRAAVSLERPCLPRGRGRTAGHAAGHAAGQSASDSPPMPWLPNPSDNPKCFTFPHAPRQWRGPWLRTAVLQTLRSLPHCRQALRPQGRDALNLLTPSSAGRGSAWEAGDLGVRASLEASPASLTPASLEGGTPCVDLRSPLSLGSSPLTGSTSQTICLNTRWICSPVTGRGPSRQSSRPACEH